VRSTDGKEFGWDINHPDYEIYFSFLLAKIVSLEKVLYKSHG
jgi:hypothetical protein